MSVTVEIDWGALLSSFASGCPIMLLFLMPILLPLGAAMLIAAARPNTPLDPDDREFTEFRDAVRR
jgi:hypothetical protein